MHYWIPMPTETTEIYENLQIAMQIVTQNQLFVHGWWKQRSLPAWIPDLSTL